MWYIIYMKLSEELLYRGFKAETTIKNPADLDTRESKKFYWGADPSADSLTIGNLAALMMCGKMHPLAIMCIPVGRKINFVPSARLWLICLTT